MTDYRLTATELESALKSTAEVRERLERLKRDRDEARARCAGHCRGHSVGDGVNSGGVVYCMKDPYRRRA